MELEFLDLFHATFTLIYVIITIICGSIILSRYFIHKNKEFLLMGFFWILLITPYLPTVITLLMIVFLNISVTIKDFVVIGVCFIPIMGIIGYIGFSGLLKFRKLNYMIGLLIMVIVGVMFEIIFFYFLFTDLSVIATYSGIFSVQWSLFSRIYFIFNLAVLLIMGILFSRQCFKSKDIEIKLKGKFLLLAFIFFIIGTILGFSLTLTIILVISRIILALSSVLFYMGFTLPDWAKKMFLKEK